MAGVRSFVFYGRKGVDSEAYSQAGCGGSFAEARSQSTMKSVDLLKKQARVLVAVDETVKPRDTVEWPGSSGAARGSCTSPRYPSRSWNSRRWKKMSGDLSSPHAMGEVQEAAIDFDALVTHDTVATIHRAASELGPQWAVIE